MLCDCMKLSWHVCVCAWMHVCVYACMHVRVYVCMHGCVYACYYGSSKVHIKCNIKIKTVAMDALPGWFDGSRSLRCRVCRWGGWPSCNTCRELPTCYNKNNKHVTTRHLSVPAVRRVHILVDVYNLYSLRKTLHGLWNKTFASISYRFYFRHYPVIPPHSVSFI